MQIKIIIGTIAFMITMMVLGYAALREPPRMERFTNAEQGRSIEAGAELFAGNCATCHGVDAMAQECYDGNGNEIACVGLPLNSAGLLCGDQSQRMEATGWDGSKRDFVLSTVSAGRGAIMPTWAEQFGGPMRPDQVNNVTNYILNFHTEALCAEPIIVFEWPEDVDEFLGGDEIEVGDPTRGEELYTATYGCAACHGQTDDEASALIGPWLGNIAVDGATRVEGQSAEQYTYESILDPSVFIAPDCPTGPCTGPPSTMLADFSLRMGDNPQDMADMLSYLLGE